MPVNLDFFTNAGNQRIAHFMKDGIHVTVRPHTVGVDPKQLQVKGFEVFFWKSNEQGDMDLSRELESCVVSGGPEDFEEIADTYARRLDAGIKPEDMFKDIKEKNLREMDRLLTEMEAGRLK